MYAALCLDIGCILFVSFCMLSHIYISVCVRLDMWFVCLDIGYVFGLAFGCMLWLYACLFLLFVVVVFFLYASAFFYRHQLCMRSTARILLFLFLLTA